MTSSERLSGRHIIIHTDGACPGNPGPGGWAYIARTMDGDTELARREASGAEPSSTNSRMEMRAAIEALASIPEDDTAPIMIVSDSKLLVQGMTGWLDGWKDRGWRRADKQAVANVDLWKQLDVLTWGRNTSWRWVRGHSGDPLNEAVDRLASAAAEAQPATGA